MTDFPDVKLKMLASFPTAVTGGSGVEVVKANGNFTIGLDYEDFSPPVSVTDAEHQNALLWNDQTNSYVLVPASELGGSSYIGREILGAGRTYYIAPTGDDSTGAGTLASPWETPSRALTAIYGEGTSPGLDVNGWTVTIQCADGTYSFAGGACDINLTWVGGSTLTIRGNPSNPAAVVWECTVPGGATFIGVKVSDNAMSGAVVVNGITFKGFHNAIYNVAVGQIYVRNCAFDHNADEIECAASGGSIYVQNTITLIGGSSDVNNCHLYARDGGFIHYSPTTVTVTGGDGIAAYTRFIRMHDAGSRVHFEPQTLLAGSIIGPKFWMHTGSQLDIEGQGAWNSPDFEVVKTALYGNQDGEIDSGARITWNTVNHGGNPENGPWASFGGGDLIKLTAAKTFYISVLSGTIAGGSLYTTGTYSAVALTGGAGTGATATITVAGGAVTVVMPSAKGTGYAVGDVLSASAASIGGTGSGFTFTITAIGSDTNAGLTVAAPFATPRGAYNAICDRYDFNEQLITLQHADGIYSEGVLDGILVGVPLTTGQRVGEGRFYFQGNTSDRTRVRYSVTGSDKLMEWRGHGVTNEVRFRFIQLFAVGGWIANFDSFLRFESCDISGGTYQFWLGGSGTITSIWGTYTLFSTTAVGGIGTHIYAEDRCYVSYLATLQIPSPLSYSLAFISAFNMCQLDMGFGTFPTGQLTGVPFFIESGAFINLYDKSVMNWALPRWGNTSPIIRDGRVVGGVGSYAYTGYVANSGSIRGSNSNEQTPTTGFSITAGDHDGVLLLTPAGTLATGTITLCPYPIDDQVIEIETSETITALTLSPNSGQTIINNPSTLAAGKRISARYKYSAAKWYCTT